MEFNKPKELNLSGDVAENFLIFKEDVLNYFTATETNKKSKEIKVARLKNLLGYDAMRLYKSITKLSVEEETVDTILEELGNTPQNHTKPPPGPLD